MKYIIFLMFLFSSYPISVTAQVKDSCDWMHGWVGVNTLNQEENKMKYDTLRRYIESCGKNIDSYDAFPALSSAVQLYDPTDTSRYNRYRDWLISVLYLNTTSPYYFCACIQAIASTYGYGKFNGTSAGLAVLNYLRQHHTECWSEYQEKKYIEDSIYAHQHHLDPEHLPTLEDLGLGFLLTHNSVSPSTALPTIYLASFTSSPNPFKTETTLSFELNRLAYVTVEVFDPLGRKVWGDDHGYSLDKGIHTVHLDGAKISSGTYYARISTGFGEVKTVKIIKE